MYPKALAFSQEIKRRIIHALIHKVVITKSGFELHYYAGVDQIREGEAVASPSFSLNKKNSGRSSFKHLNGGRLAIVGEPTTAAHKVSVAWIKPEIDPAELARSRNVEGLTMRELSRRYRMGRTTLWRLLRGRRAQWISED